MKHRRSLAPAPARARAIHAEQVGYRLGWHSALEVMRAEISAVLDQPSGIDEGVTILERLQRVMRAPVRRVPQWGIPDATGGLPAFDTVEGPVWRHTRGAAVRFFDAVGVQVGPDHPHAAAARLYAEAEGWKAWR